MKNKDQKAIETIYTGIINESVNPDAQREFDTTIEAIFRRIPLWISKGMIDVAKTNGIEIGKLKETYDYFYNFVKQNSMKKTDDEVLLQTINACQNAYNFINDFVKKYNLGK